MKATKKIVGAACALVAAVALSAGSTFAWFTSNGKVTATGMQIEVDTSNAYLIIAPTAADLSKNATSMTLDSSTTKLLPSKYETTATYAPDDATCITKEANWFTAQGTSSTDGTINTSTKQNLNAESLVFSNYVVVDEIYISVADGSGAITKVDMKLEDTSVWNDKNDAISVVILWRKLELSANSETSTVDWNHSEINAEGNHVLGTANVLELPGVSSTEYIQIKLMVYFDGEHGDVYTKNSANLEGVTLGFVFEAGPLATSEVTPGD